MKILRRSMRIFSADGRLVVSSLFVLSLVQMGIRLLPFQVMCRLASRERSRKGSSIEADRELIECVGRAVTIASRYIPSSCLVQALTAMVLLKRMRQPACLRIGVSKDFEGTLQAHAWVESQGSIVIGNLTDLSQFTPMSSLT